MNIQNIRKAIEGSSEDARFTAWLELYHSAGEESQQEIDRILKGSDPILKIFFLRFLAHIPEEKAVRFLLILLEDENTVVGEAAKRSFEKNHYEEKTKRLLPLLFSETKRAQYFAIEKLYQAGVRELIPRLLTLLARAEENLLLLILTAFRTLADKRVFLACIPFLDDAREKIRVETVFVFGALYEGGFPKAKPFLLKKIGDPSPAVRQALLWSLRRRPHAKDIPLYLSLSVADPDPSVRQEALLGLETFPHPKVISHLLSVFANEKEGIVKLKGESVLLGMPAKPLLKGLQKVFEGSNEKLHAKAMLLLCHFKKDSQIFYEGLLKRFKQVASEKEKISFLEAFGILENPKAIPLLESVLQGPAFFAYTAMQSFLKIPFPGKEEKAALTLKEKSFSALLKQMVLRHLYRKRGTYPASDSLIQNVMPCLKDENLNIRYLSAQVLVSSHHPDLVEPLLEAVLKETDPTSLKFMQESLVKLFCDHPLSVIPLLEKYRHRSPVIRFLFSLLKSEEMAGINMGPLLEKMISGSPVEELSDLISVCLAQKRIGWDSLLDLLEPFAEKEKLLSFLVKQFETGGEEKFSFPLPKLKRWFEAGDGALRQTLVRLLRYSQDPQTIVFLTSLVCRTEERSLQQEASAVLGQHLL